MLEGKRHITYHVVSSCLQNINMWNRCWEKNMIRCGKLANFGKGHKAVLWSYSCNYFPVSSKLFPNKQMKGVPQTYKKPNLASQRSCAHSVLGCLVPSAVGWAVWINRGCRSRLWGAVQMKGGIHEGKETPERNRRVRRKAQQRCQISALFIDSWEKRFEGAFTFSVLAVLGPLLLSFCLSLHFLFFSFFHVPSLPFISLS